MATRSYVGYYDEENNICKMVYVHWCGSPDERGPMLLEHYTDFSKVKELVNLGSISYIDKFVVPKNPEKHHFDTPEPDVTVAYHRDRGENYQGPSLHKIEDLLNPDTYIEYVYLFKNNKWYFADSDSEKPEFILLSSLFEDNKKETENYVLQEPLYSNLFRVKFEPNQKYDFYYDSDFIDTLEENIIDFNFSLKNSTCTITVGLTLETVWIVEILFHLLNKPNAISNIKVSLYNKAGSIYLNKLFERITLSDISLTEPLDYRKSDKLVEYKLTYNFSNCSFYSGKEPYKYKMYIDNVYGIVHLPKDVYDSIDNYYVLYNNSDNNDRLKSITMLANEEEKNYLKSIGVLVRDGVDYYVLKPLL